MALAISRRSKSSMFLSVVLAGKGDHNPFPQPARLRDAADTRGRVQRMDRPTGEADRAHDHDDRVPDGSRAARWT
jgi:hypothetical protein